MEPVVLILFLAAAMYIMANMEQGREREIRMRCPACLADFRRGQKHAAGCHWQQRL